MRKFKLYTCLLTVDTPDPYVLLRIPTAPSGKRKTKIVDNNPNPEWNETFEFYLDPDRKHVLRKYLDFKFNLGRSSSKVHKNVTMVAIIIKGNVFVSIKTYSILFQVSVDRLL